MMQSLDFWRELMGHPSPGYAFKPVVTHSQYFDYDDFICELYRQQNGPDTSQRVMMLVPRKLRSRRPAVVVPFYFPEAMLGEEPATHKPLPDYSGIEMMLHLVRRGYITVSADAYHLTYVPELPMERNDFRRWEKSAEKLNSDHPNWTGIGKLVADTCLLIDMLCSDTRVDSTRLGIAGHSLGGKMAFYSGCLDSRIKVILASDFGICWNQTNWDDSWYWGKSRIAEFQSAGITHRSLLQGCGNKPLGMLAGKYDNEDSLRMLREAGYEESSSHLCFVNHATGHRPPQWALERGYVFLDTFLVPGKE